MRARHSRVSSTGESWRVTTLDALAAADFVVALYNPRSTRRQEGLAEAARILLAHRPPDTPVLIARNLGRADESVHAGALSNLTIATVDMLTIVIVGSSMTRTLAGNPPRLYTPRGYDRT